MLFSSWSFAVFLPLVFVLHFAGRSSAWQTGILTLASFVFYGWHTPWLVILLALSTTLNSEAARRLLDTSYSLPSRKTALTIAILFNLGALAFFKYSKLLGHILLPNSLAEKWMPSLESIPLPVGISFYTFQGLSLVIDAWRAGPQGLPGLPVPSTPKEHLSFQSKVWFFKAFFPQLIAGPIVKAHDFLYQIVPKRISEIDWASVTRLLISGFFLKMVVADNLKEATAALKAPLFYTLPKINLIALLYGFSCQIFADFFGYSLIAMGLAKLFGYQLPINFDRPYLATSLTDFWRRWHISLSSWLRSYLYIPLGGNRSGPLRTYFNLFIVMFLGGLWHGAAWSYAIWGTAHGLGLAIERLLGVGKLDTPRSLWVRIIGTFGTFTLVSFLWLFFKLPQFQDVITFLQCLVQNPNGAQGQNLYVIGLFSIPVVVYHVFPRTLWWQQCWSKAFGPATRLHVESAFYAILLLLIVVNSGTPGDFIYFQF